MDAKKFSLTVGILLISFILTPLSLEGRTISPDHLRDLPTDWKNPILDFDDALRNQFTSPSDMDDFFNAAKDYVKQAEDSGKEPGVFEEFLFDYAADHPGFATELSMATEKILGEKIGLDTVAGLRELVIKVASKGSLEDMDLKNVDDLKTLVEKLRDELEKEKKDAEDDNEELAKKIDEKLENMLEKIGKLDEKEKEAYERMMEDMDRMQEQAQQQLAQTQVPPEQQQKEDNQEPKSEGGGILQMLMAMLMMMMQAKQQGGGGGQC